MNQCFPTSECTFSREVVDEKAMIQIAPRVGKKTFLMQCANKESVISEVTYWLSHLLRSLSLPCIVGSTKKKDCPVCIRIRKHIRDKCANSYIDGWSLNHHTQHVSREYDYLTDGLKVKTSDEVKLAYYHPEGVDFRIFPYQESKK